MTQSFFFFTSEHFHNFSFLFQVDVPGCILCSLEYVDVEDLARPLAIVAKMVRYRPLALQLLKEGLLTPSRVAALLEGPTAKDILLDFLMIISDLARMSKVCRLLAYWHLSYMAWKDVTL